MDEKDCSQKGVCPVQQYKSPGILNCKYKSFQNLINYCGLILAKHHSC